MGSQEEDAARRAAVIAAQRKAARPDSKYWASMRLMGWSTVGVVILSIIVGWFRQTRWAISSRDVQRAEKQFLSGNIFFEAGDLGTAVRQYRMAVQTNPFHADAWTNIGNALSTGIQHASQHRDRIYADAVRAYEEAVRVERRHVDAHFNLGVLHHTLERVDLAIPAYERAVRIDPLHHDALSNLGSARHKINDLQGAIKAYKEAIRIVSLLDESQVDHQMLSMLHYLLGSAVSSQEDKKCQPTPCAQEAANLVRTALRINHDNTEAAEALAGMRTDENVTLAAQQRAAELFQDFELEMEGVRLNGVSYRVPSLIREALERVAPPGGWEVGLDLGCGLGATGREIRGLAASLAGMDKNASLVERLRNGSLTSPYTEVLDAGDLAARGGLGQFGDAKKRAGTVGVVTAGDTFVFFGDLGPPVAAAARALAKGGLLAFTVDALALEEVESDGSELKAEKERKEREEMERKEGGGKGGGGDKKGGEERAVEDEESAAAGMLKVPKKDFAQGFTPRSEGRYAHTRAHVEAVLAKNDLRVLSLEVAPSRKTAQGAEGHNVTSFVVVAELPK